MDEPASVVALKKIRARKERPPFILFRDLRESTNKEWLVHGLLGAGEASVMYGKPGDGKSVLAEDLALHVAAGRDWHGRKIKQGAVLFIALERRKLIERRAIAFREKYGVANLPFAIVGGIYDFRQRDVAEAICETVGDLKEVIGEPVVLIVIDTLSRALCGGDENSSKDMGAIVAATSHLQETGAHILWLHHTPLAADERMRGHGALLGAVDTTLHVAKTTDGVRTATVMKANDSEEGVTISFRIDSVTIGTDEIGNTTTAPIVMPVDGVERRQAGRHLLRSKAARVALHALEEAIAEAGEAAPASNHIPQGIKVATIEMWRRYAYARSISPSEKIRARQAAFQRATEHLIADGFVKVWNDHAWIIKEENP
jgi:hypothetical protein